MKTQQLILPLLEKYMPDESDAYFKLQFTWRGKIYRFQGTFTVLDGETEEKARRRMLFRHAAPVLRQDLRGQLGAELARLWNTSSTSVSVR